MFINIIWMWTIWSLRFAYKYTNKHTNEQLIMHTYPSASNNWALFADTSSYLTSTWSRMEIIIRFLLRNLFHFALYPDLQKYQLHHWLNVTSLDTWIMWNNRFNIHRLWWLLLFGNLSFCDVNTKIILNFTYWKLSIYFSFAQDWKTSYSHWTNLLRKFLCNHEPHLDL